MGQPTGHEQPEKGAPGGRKGEARVVVRLCRLGSDRCERLKPAKISEVIKQAGTLLWVDICDPGPHELEILRQEFGFHRLALEDAGKQRQRAKVDEYPGYFFVVLYAPLPQEPGKPARTVEVDLFVGRNYLVTLHPHNVDAIHAAEQRWERTDPELRREVGFLVHTVVDEIIDDYFPVVDALEDQLDRQEMMMLRSRVRSHPEVLLSVKRSLYTLRKAVYPMREVFNTFLRRDHNLFAPETYPYFQDVYDHVLRLLDTLDVERDMATGVLDAHLAVVSNQLNETMKILTVAAICVAVMGAVFGAWGMNFTHVPLDYLGIRGFWLVFGGTAALLGVVLAVSRKIGFW